VVRLSPTERALFECLLSATPHVVTSQRISEWMWGEPLSAERRAVLRVYVGYLRKKLSASRFVVIQSMQGIGYALSHNATPNNDVVLAAGSLRQSVPAS
jgi:DNA-binding response OmpR family regulator